VRGSPRPRPAPARLATIAGPPPRPALRCVGGVAVVGDPASDGARIDAEEAGDFGLGVAVQDAGDGEATTILKFDC
jgi:hypothetical protein